MVKKSDLIKKYISLLFYFCFTAVSGFILVLSILRPQNHLFPWQMAVGTVLVTVAFCAVGIFWNRVYEKTYKGHGKKAWDIAFPVLLFLFWAGLYAIGLLHGDHHPTGDYEILFASAVETAEGKELTYRNYFLVYGNNTEPMLLLAAVIRICRFFKINEFPVLLLLSSGLVPGSVLAVKSLLPQNTGRKWAIPLTLFFFLCLPVYVFTPNFYTDTMSFGLGVIALAFFKIAFGEREKTVKTILFAVLAALFTALGTAVKITSVIPLIAAFLVFFLSSGRKPDKKYIKPAVAGILGFGIFFLAMHLYFSSFSVYGDSKKLSNPTISWIALGMREDGSYAKNVEFSDTLNAITDPDAKAEYVKGYMKEHVSEAFSPKHIADKAQHNFAGGTFTGSDFTAKGEREAILYELMDPGGKYYWRTSQITFCYVALIYAMYVFGGVTGILLLIRGTKLSFVKFTADLAFFGIFVFLMIWEANNRQLYNQVPILITALFCNLELFIGLISKIRNSGKKTEEK